MTHNLASALGDLCLHSTGDFCFFSAEEEMATLREKVEALEKENKKMKEEMRRLSGMSAANAVATPAMTSVDDGGGGGSEEFDYE